MSSADVTLQDIRDAATRIAGRTRTTPLLESPLLNETLGFRLLVKAENLQHTGAFKVRGAFNQILQLNDEEKRAGVFAMSAGNHAQAIAYVARKFGIAATILMPSDAPKVKVDNTRAFGATVHFYDRATEDRNAIGQKLARDRGLRLIHSYDDPRTIAGQGTIGLEIHQQAKELGAVPDAIVAGCSGGGLTAGIALTRGLYETPPQIYTAEPEGFDDMRRSLETGVPQVNKAQSGTICDALALPTPGLHPLRILLREQAKGLTVPDAATEGAMALAAEEFRITLEPGGAVALACAIRHHDMFKGKTVAVVASGGNVDQPAYIMHIGNPWVTHLRLPAPTLN